MKLIHITINVCLMCSTKCMISSSYLQLISRRLTQSQAYVLNVIPAANDIVTWQFITFAITAVVITVSRDCSDFVGATAPIFCRTHIYAAYYRRLTDKRNENKLQPVVLSLCQGILLMKETVFGQNCGHWCHTVLSSRGKSVKTRSRRQRTLFW